MEDRIERLQALLPEIPADGLIIEDKVNLFYLTGQELSAGKLIVHTDGASLIVDGRYYETCRKRSRIPVLQSEKYPLSELLDTEAFFFIKTLAFNSDNTSYGNFLELKKAVKACQREIALVPANNPVQKLRMIKEKGEIEALSAAAKLGSEGFDYVCTLLKEGITELEIAIELEIFWKRRGSKAIAFDPIIAFGANSSMPHYRVGNEKLKKGQNVLIDIGVNYEHYHSDMTRVIFFGEPDPKIETIYKIVQEAQQAALELCRPGTTIGALDSAARDLIESHGYGENFTHSLGHGVGLEIHEFPTIRNKPPYNEIVLEPGMVITIEPGIYLPGIGGVRIEDTVAITASSHENLTQRDKNLIEI